MKSGRIEHMGLNESVEYIRSKSGLSPSVAMVLGSGLGGLSEIMEIEASISYSDIPGFMRSTAVGHAGKLLLGHISGVPCAVMSGRNHMYEGYTAAQVAYPVYALKRLGVQKLILTNAAGAVNQRFAPGDLMLITDHLNLMGVSPVVPDYIREIGAQFTDMSKAYAPELIARAEAVAQELGVMLRRGVYAMFLGPQFETPAEIRMARMLGADAVGMSTVPEVIAAAHCGMKTLVISCMTNMAAGILDQPITHEEVLETGHRVEDKMKKLLIGLAASI
jgi:purine-nucleoside phosphorylase